MFTNVFFRNQSQQDVFSCFSHSCTFQTSFRYTNQNLTFWLKFTFFFFDFVSEKLSKNYEMYLTNSQVSVKNFDNLI
jgi:hypothetical protein